MIDFPCAKPAMVTALMVCDLLVGIRTSPRSVDCSLIILKVFFSILKTPDRSRPRPRQRRDCRDLRGCDMTKNAFAASPCLEHLIHLIQAKRLASNRLRRHLLVFNQRMALLNLGGSRTCRPRPGTVPNHAQRVDRRLGHRDQRALTDLARRPGGSRTPPSRDGLPIKGE